MSSPFESPGAREQQRQKTRARIFEAALAEFARVGFDRASVAEIARRAGVSRPSFYFHFPTKEYVLLELQWRKELEIMQHLERCATLTEVLTKLPDALLDVLDTIEGDVARDMIRIYAKPPGDLPLAEQPFPLVQLLARRFAEGARELRVGMEPGQAARLCLTGVFGYLMTSGPDHDPRDDLRVLASLFLGDPAASA